LLLALLLSLLLFPLLLLAFLLFALLLFPLLLLATLSLRLGGDVPDDHRKYRRKSHQDNGQKHPRRPKS
jgi:hypothetical protein